MGCSCFCTPMVSVKKLVALQMKGEEKKKAVGAGGDTATIPARDASDESVPTLPGIHAAADERQP